MTWLALEKVFYFGFCWISRCQSNDIPVLLREMELHTLHYVLYYRFAPTVYPFLFRPSEVVECNKEYTVEDVTGQVVKGSFPMGSSEHEPFKFPGLRSGLHSDIEAIERSMFGSMTRFFDAAEEMKNGFFNAFGTPHLYDRDSPSSSATRRGIPIEGHPPKEASTKPSNPDGNVDLSGLARDV